MNVMPPPQNPSRKLLAGLFGAVLAALALWLSRRQAEPPPPHTPPAPTVANFQPAAPAHPLDGHAQRLREMGESLKASADAANSRRSLAQWRAELAAMPRDAAVSAIRQFLNSKEDAPTHLGFKVSGSGLLDEAPTLRTFLLDELARIDPAAAADYSKVILAGMDSPDEWAVALRNLASGDSSADGRALLEQKTIAMLQYQPWQQNPSVGYLEGFDVAVYLGGTDLLPTLSDLVRQQDPALSHASYLALDRLVINNPATVLGALEAAPDLMQGREATRADYFARADVRDPQQRQVLETYLLNPSLSASELQTFAGIYPNANYMISPNLLTPTPTPDHNALMDRDAQSLAVVQQWMADPRFASLGPALQSITARLRNFVQQASQGRQ
jgi:hypothetical protein